MRKEALNFHKGLKGKIAIVPKVDIKTRRELSLAYTPGVAYPCVEIAKDKKKVYKYTIKSNTVAVVTDGSAVLGLGDIGAEAALPVMEGKAVLFKRFGGIDAFPICLATKDVDEIVEIVKLIAPVFGGINLEDISAPRCFDIEKRLIDELDIPVMHDDQHGTAIVVLAALINALKITKKDRGVRIAISGAGAAGIAVAKILLNCGFKNIILCDRAGIIYRGRKENMNKYKIEISKKTNKERIRGSLADAMKGADVFIGVSTPGIVSKEMIRSMNKNPIVFAMANPVPEIMPNEAKKAGAAVIATGRSDFPNQINNVLAFPGVFKGALKTRTKITDEIKIAAAYALAKSIKPTKEKIIPSVFDKGVADSVARAVVRCS